MNNAGIHDDGVNEQRPVHREKVSVDDFEHLLLDNSPTQGDANSTTSVSLTSAARDTLGKIDKIADTSESLINIVDAPKEPENLDDIKSNYSQELNLFEMGDTLLEKAAEGDDTMDTLISQLTSFAPSVPSHDVSPIIEPRMPKFKGLKNFLDMERKIISKELSDNSVAKILDMIESVTGDAEEKQPEIPEEKYVHKESPEHELISEFIAPNTSKHEPVFAEIPVQKVSEPVTKPIIVETITPPKPSPQVTYSPPEQYMQEPPQHPVVQSKVKHANPVKSQAHVEPAITDAEVIFKKMGLDAWFHPERLTPQVASLIYWRDPAKSGPVFGGVLIILLALTYLSLISVVAYLSLLALTATISFRIYKNVVHAVQKTGDGHPFKDFLDMDISLPQEKVKECIETAIAHANAAAVELRRLFLVDDLVDSIKFGVLLWCFTYVGAWFNGMTIVILAWVALFTLPKVYETNKTQIDANLDLVRSKIAEITSKVKAAIPIGKKEEKKEQ